MVEEKQFLRNGGVPYGVRVTDCVFFHGEKVGSDVEESGGADSVDKLGTDEKGRPTRWNLTHI